MEKTYSMKQVADMFDVTLATVKRWCDCKYIGYDVVKNRAVFTDVHIETFKKVGKEKGYQIVR